MTKKFIGIREEWMRPLPKLSEMFVVEEKCGCCIDCGACSCAGCKNSKSSKKTRKKTSKKEE